MTTRILTLLAISAAATLSCANVEAKESETNTSASGNRMATCSQEAKGLKGEEREKFLSKCLKANGASTSTKPQDKGGASHLAGQQNRMKACNAEAREKDLHGDERKAFMSRCLKG
jgi:hypothetical protein